MRQPRLQSGVGRLRWIVTILAVVSILSVDVMGASTSFAKDVDLTGTVDCGLRSGRRCDIGDALMLWTDSLTGVNERVTIDVSWIKNRLPALDQDDEITLSVEVLPNGKLQGSSVISARKRDGTENQGLSTGSLVRTESRRDRGQQQDQDDTPNTSGQQTVTLRGTVVSLMTGDPIAGATVQVASATATTDSAGAFSIGGLSPGTYQATASAPGFISQSQTVNITPSIVAQATFSLPTAFPDIALTVTWGSQPTDLDAHLSGPATGGGRFHAYFLDPNPEPYAGLTMQDDLQFGPEQIVIRRDPGTGQFAAGDYHFWVHNFSATPDFDVSQGRVVVTKDNQLLGIFEVGAATGDPSLDLWHVVNLQVDAAGNVNLVSVQTFTNGDSFVILRPPYGAKPKSRRR